MPPKQLSVFLLKISILPIILFSFTAKAQRPGCIENYFLKTYTNADSSTLPFDMVITGNNDVIISGSIRNSVPNDYEDGFILRLDNTGSKLWEITLTGPQLQHCRKIIRLRDNNFLVAGYDFQYSSFFLLKIDINGNIIWRKNIVNTDPASNPGIGNIKEGADGSIYIVSFYSEALSHGMLFSKCDNAGSIIYSHHYKVANPINPIDIRDMVIKDDFSYIVGAHMNETNPTYVHNGFLTKMDNTTGNLLWTKMYNYNNGPEIFQQIFDYGPGQLCILGQNTINASDLNNLLICDTSGTIQHLSYFQFGDYRQFGNATMDSSGNILYSNYLTGNGPVDLAMCLINPYTGVKWGRHFPVLKPFPRIIKLLFGGNNDIYSVGNVFPNKGYMFFGKHSSQGDVGCVSEPLAIRFGEGSSHSISINFTHSLKSFSTVSGVAPPVTHFITEGLPLCNVPSTCTSLILQGRDTLCNLTDTLLLNIIKDPGCFSVPKLIYDTSFFKLLTYENNIAKFVAQKTGVSSIAVEMILSCDTLTDHLPIHIFNSPRAVDLGPDFSLCPGNTMILNARKGFHNYRWHDGSIDSTFLVTASGEYFVEATDFCGNVLTDTVFVSQAPPVSLELAKYLQKCNDDSLKIIAPTGFLNYSWSPNYNITSVTGQSVDVFPAVDTIYKLTAEKTPGCFAYDSIRVRVYQSPPIDLGADKSFCSGETALLNAGTGFQNYSWNNGAIEQRIMVHSIGDYSVIGTTTEGCKSYDTLRIMDVWNNPVVTLNKDSTLCIGSSRTLQAGNFSLYLWQNGSNASSFTVISPGTYNVTVWDNNHCKGSDTIHITKLLPLPANFLPGDAFICNYGKLDIKANAEYKTYSWSNNAVTSSITVTQPGIYWLQVSDETNCTGKDSIVVNPKDCLTGFYIPTAFTPNNDGLNDFFKPFIGGNVKQYQFNIYNRWGQVVFTTTEINKGWDGWFKGSVQDSHVFAWSCTYQLEGEPMKREKGTVVLIR